MEVTVAATQTAAAEVVCAVHGWLAELSRR